MLVHFGEKGAGTSGFRLLEVLPDDVVRYDFLSNSYPCNITIDDVQYSSVEEAFNSAEWGVDQDEVMKALLEQKFISNPDLKQKLLDTGETEILVINYEHENFWGICQCENCQEKMSRKPAMQIQANRLGLFLAIVRNGIRAGDYD